MFSLKKDWREFSICLGVFSYLKTSFNGSQFMNKDPFPDQVEKVRSWWETVEPKWEQDHVCWIEWSQWHTGCDILKHWVWVGPAELWNSVGEKNDTLGSILLSTWGQCLVIWGHEKRLRSRKREPVDPECTVKTSSLVPETSLRSWGWGQSASSVCKKECPKRNARAKATSELAPCQ